MASREELDKINRLIDMLLRDKDKSDAMFEALERNSFRALKKISIENFEPVTDPERLANAKIGLLADVETTGLDYQKDEVIQLSMLKIRYDAHGILAIDDVFDRLREPSIPIPAEVTALTGITPEMVKGQVIDQQDIVDFISAARRAICHNASFDRKFVEKQFPDAGFDKLAFDCSIAQIDWMAHGINGRSQELIALHMGYCYGSHNALNDTTGLAFILNGAPGAERSPFAELLENGETPMRLIVLKGLDYNPERNAKLKTEGFRFCDDGSETCGIKKVWHKTILNSEEEQAKMADFLREIYKRDVHTPSWIIEPTERYSARMPENRIDFATTEITSSPQRLDMQPVGPESQQNAFSF